MRAISKIGILLGVWGALCAGLALSQPLLLHSGSGGGGSGTCSGGLSVHLTAPNDFTNAAWVKSNVTAASGVSDPLSGTAASSITTSVASSPNVKQTAGSLTGLTSYTFTAYFKVLTAPQWILWQVSDDVTERFGKWANIATRTVGASNDFGAGSSTLCFNLGPAGNGYTFASMTGQLGATITANFEILLVDANGSAGATLNQSLAGYQMSP